VVERSDSAPVATFYAADLPSGPEEVLLGEAAVHHAVVRRLSVNDDIRLTTGAGTVAHGVIRSIGKREVVVALHTFEAVVKPPLLEVLVPVADRDRMLWLAEKCAELAVSVWQPVIFSRSRSVSPRGEGDAFATKVRGRMVAALEQSGGAWLPDIRREVSLEQAVDAVGARARYVLNRVGQRLDPAKPEAGAAVIFGPEGGIEPDEHQLLQTSGWTRVGLAPTTLRFETAGIAAVAILRAAAVKANSET
jgi:16S rRNA (uracil1498-N3)-methyltransferase